MRFWVGLIAALALSALVVTLVLKNGQDVEVHLVALVWPTKLWAAMVAAALVGAAVTGIVLAWPLARLKVQARRRAKRIHELEQEVHGLRTLPIASDAASPPQLSKV
jgi:uncharacterized integral membrane protein